MPTAHYCGECGEIEYSDKPHNHPAKPPYRIPSVEEMEGEKPDSTLCRYCGGSHTRDEHMEFEKAQRESLAEMGRAVEIRATAMEPGNVARQIQCPLVLKCDRRNVLLEQKRIIERQAKQLKAKDAEIAKLHETSLGYPEMSDGKETRSESLGRRMAENINEAAHLFYDTRTKANFYRGLTRCLMKRHEVRGIAAEMLKIEKPQHRGD